MKGARMCLLNVVEEEAGVASSHQQGWSWILEKHLQACRRGLPSWNHVAGCGWWICYRMADKWLHCARLLCFQSTVCRTRRVYYTRCQMRSLQCSDSQAEPRHASLPGFTQTGTVIVSDNPAVCYTCLWSCNRLVLTHQTSSNQTHWETQPRVLNIRFWRLQKSKLPGAAAV